MSLAPIVLTGGTTRGMTPTEVEALKRNLQTLYSQLHPREASQPESEIYAQIERMSVENRVAWLAQRYADIESVLEQYKLYARENESKHVAYLKDARKVVHSALAAAGTAYLNDQRLEGVEVSVERGAPLSICRADVLLGTNDDPALPLSMVVAAIDRACAAVGVELPGAVLAALPAHVAALRATMSTKPAVIRRKRA